MIKFIGILFTVLSFSACGFSYAANLIKRIEQLNELKKITIMLEGELRYGNATIEEAITSIAVRTSRVFSDFLNDAAGRLAANNGESFYEIWESSTSGLLKTSKLSSDDIGELNLLGETLGYLDLKAQSESILLYRERLELRLKELNEGADKKIKMYRSLGVSMGLLTAIILL